MTRRHETILRGRMRGFSLIELLAVVAIMVIALALSLPAISSTQEGLEITRGTDMVVDALNLARQRALSLNCPVVVRFYVPANDPTTDYSRLQILALHDDGTLEPLARMQRLPERAVISRAPELGNVFSDAPAAPHPALSSEAGLLASELLVRRDGTVDLPGNDSGFLTVVPRNSAGITDPANFGIVTIEPLNANVAQLRP